MPWKETVNKGPERHFNIQLHDTYTVSNGPFAGETRMVDTNEVFAHNLRRTLSNKWKYPEKEYPLTNVFVVAEMSADAKLSKFWLDSFPKSADLEKAVSGLLQAPGTFDKIPKRHDGRNSDSWPAQFWINVTTENTPKRKFFGARGPFMTELVGIDKMRTASAKDARFALSKGYTFWLSKKVSSKEMVERSSLPIDLVTAQRKQVSRSESVESSSLVANTFAGSNKPLMAAFKAGQQALAANDMAGAQQRAIQCVGLANTEKECTGTATMLCTSTASRLLDAKQKEKAVALIDQIVAASDKKGFNMASANALIGMMKVNQDDKDKAGFTQTVTRMRDEMKSALSKLKPGQQDASGAIAGFSIIVPLGIGTSLGRMGMTEEESKPVGELMKEMMEMAEEANRIAPTPGMTFGKSK